MATSTDVTFDEARHEMVDSQCRARGIRDERVLSVMSDIPRERFVLPAMKDEAYADRALPLEFSATISQPYIVAYMTAALELHPANVVLEVGTGSGYQTAILAKLARHVFTIERMPELSRQAAARLHDLAIENVSYEIGDGSAGWPRWAPYDRILVTAGAPRIPSALVQQLVIGGRMILPIGVEESQVLTCIERTLDGIVEHPLAACRFVKLIGKEGWAEP